MGYCRGSTASSSSSSSSSSLPRPPSRRRPGRLPITEPSATVACDLAIRNQSLATRVLNLMAIVLSPAIHAQCFAMVLRNLTLGRADLRGVRAGPL
eukprot:6758532-Pyramimonas_sp.AAC.1